jgi:hypothetical protein
MTYCAYAGDKARVDQAIVRSDCDVMCMLVGRNALLGSITRFDLECDGWPGYARERSIYLNFCQGVVELRVMTMDKRTSCLASSSPAYVAIVHATVAR